jgi:hypothetical protein
MTRLFSNHTPAAIQLFVTGINVIRCRSIAGLSASLFLAGKNWLHDASWA